MFRLAHSPLNINKKSYRTCVCGDIETEIHLFFYCNFHDDARAILSNRVCNIVIDNKSPEFFVCLSNVELLRIFLFGLPDEESSRISVAVFRPVDDFLKSCNRFDNIRATLYTIYGRFVLSCCIFFVDADRLQLSLYLCDVPDASTSFQCCIQYCWCVPVVPYEMLAMQCIYFCVSICFNILFALLHYHRSTWHDKIAPIRLPPVARLSLNK